MPKKYKTSIFIFTRDLRLSDNTSLISALNESNSVLPIFILTPEQLDDKNKEADNQQKLLKQIQDEAERAQLAANAKHQDMISALEKRAIQAENESQQKTKDLATVQNQLLELNNNKELLSSELDKAKLEAQEAGNNNVDLNNKVKSYVYDDFTF